MRVAIQTSTGKPIEMQSDATEGTLIANAVASGFAISDVEERVMTPEQYRQLAATFEAPPAPAGPTLQDVIAALKAKAVISDADLQTAKATIEAAIVADQPVVNLKR